MSKKKQKFKTLCTCKWSVLDIKLVEIQDWVYFIDNGYRHVHNPYTFAYAKCEYIKELATKQLNEARAILLIGNLTGEGRYQGDIMINEFTEAIESCNEFKEILIENKYRIVSPEEDDRVSSNPELTHEYVMSTFGDKVKPAKSDYLNHVLDLNLPVKVNTHFKHMPFKSTEYMIDIMPLSLYDMAISNIISTRNRVAETNINFLLEYNLFYKLYNNNELSDDSLITSMDEIPYNLGIGIIYKGYIVPVMISVVPNCDVTSVDSVVDKEYTISICVNQITLDPAHYNPYKNIKNLGTTNNCIFEFNYNATTGKVNVVDRDDVFIADIMKLHKKILYMVKYIWERYTKSRKRNAKVDSEGIFIPTSNSEDNFNKAVQSNNLTVPETYNKGYITLKEYVELDKELRKVDKEYKKHSSHSSPREHVRKGFYRRTKNGALVYVKSTVVNKGKTNNGKPIVYKLD